MCCGVQKSTRSSTILIGFLEHHIYVIRVARRGSVMPNSRSRHGFSLIGALVSLSLVSSCATAAGLGDDALHMATLGRVQATPFTDPLAAKDCRKRLDQNLGFPRESRAMKDGVMVVQSFDCKADQIIAKVSLTNRTDEPKYCFAETETSRSGVFLPPKGVGFFEYVFSDSAWQDCDLIG